MGGGRAPSIAPWLLLFLALLPLAVAAGERANKSSLGGIFWATGKDESDLLTKVESSSSDDDDLSTTVAVEDDEFAGGFSSLDGMLQWAIGHSDPVQLKEKANDIQRLSANELKRRQLEIKELMERLKMPSDAELMQIAIDDLNNSSLSLEDRQGALNELMILVESIDNANDLHKLDGLVAIVRELRNSETEIRTTSSWILGKASQNNIVVQNQILALGALTRLMKMVKSGYTEEAIKALYAISALVRNNDNAQDLFYSEDGNLLLQDIMSNSSVDIRLQKKAALLVADLADHHLDNPDKANFPFISSPLLLKSVVDLISSHDLDLQEKALLAIRSLLQLTTTEAAALDFRDYCGLDRALERMREHLEMTAQDEEQRDHAGDMEGLRREVHIIFNRKLQEVSPMVPT